MALSLGYLAFGVSDLDAWRRFGTGVLGMDVRDEGDGLKIRMDAHAARFHIEPGGDRLNGVGWEADEATFADIIDRLRSAAVDVVLDATLAQRRGVESLARFRDPAGTPVELHHGPTMASEPFESDRVSGFVTGSQGLGHLVISAKTKAESLAFYTETLGFKLSDHITCNLGGYPVDLAFLHCNPRHHSVAFGGPQPAGLHHFMVEAATIDDVGAALDRTLRAGLKVVNTLGRHPNDQMLSFYAKTPSGFQFEFGWGGREVDDATWQTTTYDRISDWGHTPPALLKPRKKT